MLLCRMIDFEPVVEEVEVVEEHKLDVAVAVDMDIAVEFEEEEEEHTLAVEVEEEHKLDVVADEEEVVEDKHVAVAEELVKVMVD